MASDEERLAWSMIGQTVTGASFDETYGLELELADGRRIRAGWWGAYCDDGGAELTLLNDGGVSGD